jgi:hypothetical protein
VQITEDDIEPRVNGPHGCRGTLETGGDVCLIGKNYESARNSLIIR